MIPGISTTPFLCLFPFFSKKFRAPSPLVAQFSEDPPPPFLIRGGGVLTMANDNAFP